MYTLWPGPLFLTAGRLETSKPAAFKASSTASAARSRASKSSSLELMSLTVSLVMAFPERHPAGSSARPSSPGRRRDGLRLTGPF